MYTLKSIATRGTALGAAFALVAAAVIPGAVALAAELNPLTNRSLLLSSSAPGFVDTDGSNYSTANPNPAAAGSGGTIPGTYAPAGSGPNGKKTGETFSFNVTSTAGIAGISLQYCTKAAGDCVAPGNNTGDADPDNNGNGVGAASTREDNEDAHPNSRSDFEVVGTFAQSLDNTPAAGEFAILGDDGNVVSGTDWTMTAVNVENDTNAPGVAKTGKKNMIYLSKAASSSALTGGDAVKVIFKASESTYITNPGDDEFFVKINTYNTGVVADMLPTTDANIVDGGVTVANVMTDSIHITTKVLETMSFSVGNENPDNVDGSHGTCDVITQNNNNRISLGNVSAENSLETGQAYDAHSYWRLSSNSSGGASVYYSGTTLSNTVGDEIADMPTKTASRPGTEQFGLGFVDVSLETPDAPGDFPVGYTPARSYPFITVTGQAAGAPYNTLTSQPVSDDYADATGTLGTPGADGTAEFTFRKTSLTVPEVIAEQNEQVISCATAKMRYVGNIAADTPAGVYTTRINYLAAPQY